MLSSGVEDGICLGGVFDVYRPAKSKRRRAAVSCYELPMCPSACSLRPALRLRGCWFALRAMTNERGVMQSGNNGDSLWVKFRDNSGWALTFVSLVFAILLALGLTLPRLFDAADEIETDGPVGNEEATFSAVGGPVERPWDGVEPATTRYLGDRLEQGQSLGPVTTSPQRTCWRSCI